MSDVKAKEKPILFSAPMVRAILAGRKTQTRRIVKPQPPEDWYPLGCDRYCPTKVAKDGEEYPGDEIFGAYDEDWGVACPYGGPGDRLWVKETWQRYSNGDKATEGNPVYQGTHDVFYRADESDPNAVPLSGKWRPSIFMPRWASRITLEITNVRVERVQYIKPEDLASEGYEGDIARIQFADLWDKLNGAGSWESNPWVWAISFKVL